MPLCTEEHLRSPQKYFQNSQIKDNKLRMMRERGLNYYMQLDEEKCKKAKWLSEEALQTAMKRREAKRKG